MTDREPQGLEQAAALISAGRTAEAEALLLKVSREHPENRSVAVHLSRLYESTGRIYHGLAVWRRYLPYETEPQTRKQIFKSLIREPDEQNNGLLKVWFPEYGEALEELFAEEGMEVRNLAKPTAVLLTARYQIHPRLDLRRSNIVEQLARDPLFLTLLSQTINVDLDMEDFLIRLRRHLLLTLGRAQGVEPFHGPLLAALALQCFSNEYLYNTEPMEQRALTKMTGKGSWLEQEHQIMLMACYGPLTAYGSQLEGKETGSPHFRMMITRLVSQPMEEQALKAGIPALGSIANQTSQTVRAQYEEHPYPRWLRLPPEKLDFAATLKLVGANPQPPDFLNEDHFDVLIAGCGTGRHPLKFAVNNPKARVLAVDLSQSSLAYASRMARVLKVDNIRFLQADILELGALNRSFHHIESVGVLHHMKDPEQGWAVLTGLLKPGGFMRIGLYSELGRAAIVAARRAIAQLGLQATPEQMRQFRSDLITQPEHRHILAGLQSWDFFSLSSFRDLIFHAMEHRFTIARLQRDFQELDLEFLGFNLNPLYRDKYKALYPEDLTLTNLNNWAVFEEKHPAVFHGMYQFLVRTRP